MADFCSSQMAISRAELAKVDRVNTLDTTSRHSQLIAILQAIASCLAPADPKRELGGAGKGLLWAINPLVQAGKSS